MSILDNYKRLQEKVKTAAERSGRKAEDIIIVAVTKTNSHEIIDEAVKSGITDIGENRIQEAEDKFKYITVNPVKHLIGHLQRNKVKKALRLFDIIHSVDNIALAKEINKHAEKPITSLIEVNVGKESQKSGILPDELPTLLEEISKLDNIDCRGLMVIPPFMDDQNKVRPYFKRTAQLLDETNKMKILEYDLTELSMGMTGDFEAAVEEGATIIRVGTAIFGPRSVYKMLNN